MSWSELHESILSRNKEDVLSSWLEKGNHHNEIHIMLTCFHIIQGNHILRYVADPELATEQKEKSPVIPLTHIDSFTAFKNRGVDTSATSEPENYFTFPGLRDGHSWLTPKPCFNSDMTPKSK